MVKENLNFLFILSIENIKTNQTMQEKKEEKYRHLTDTYFKKIKFKKKIFLMFTVFGRFLKFVTFDNLLF